MVDWVQGHGEVVGLLSAALLWCWRIDTRVSILMDKVDWMRDHGCALASSCKRHTKSER